MDASIVFETRSFSDLMGVGIAGQKTNEDAAIELPGIGGRAAWRLAYEGRHVLVGGVIFVVVRASSKQLVEFLEMNPRAARQPVKTVDQQRAFMHTPKRCDDSLDGLVVGQGRTDGDRKSLAALPAPS